MSQENVEVVRTMWEAFLRRDFDQSLAAFHPDVEWDGTNLPDGTISRGHQAIIDHSARWFGMWEDWTIELGEFVDVGDDVVVFIRGRDRAAARLLDAGKRRSDGLREHSWRSPGRATCPATIWRLRWGGCECRAVRDPPSRRDHRPEGRTACPSTSR